MKFWPVPNSYSKEIPASNTLGSFWENRVDRYHCGVDIYAPESSKVLSIEDGKVIDVGLFTSPYKLPYWNKTFYILIQNNTGLVCKYAELGDVIVDANESVKAGQSIGYVGLVLNSNKITEKSPSYIQKIKKKQNLSMLHFELYNSLPSESKNYLGGNWFDSKKPESLLDPTDYLRSTNKKRK